mmetsp:Transcript_26465/g.82638  ORF Transcript_26465/g.82638 Transcript_26465/m.82638 type:complete len:1298 (+) Transcript_26465:325-4218(+)
MSSHGGVREYFRRTMKVLTQIHDEPKDRTVPLGDSSSLMHVFGDNHLKTSKYTMVNFFPLSLFMQFRKAGNVYFLCMSMLMLLGMYTDVFQTPITAYTTLVPLSIVLAISMGQEALADSRRHRADKEVNNRRAVVIESNNGGIAATKNSERSGEASVRTLSVAQRGFVERSSQAARQLHDREPDESPIYRNRPQDDPPRRRRRGRRVILWQDIVAGDLVVVRNHEQIPSDLVLLASSDKDALAYVETSSIDGETNLKLRSSAIPPRYRPRVPEDGRVRSAPVLQFMRELQGNITCEPPNICVNSFTGKLTLKSTLNSNQKQRAKGIGAGSDGPKDDAEASFPLDVENIMLRGSVLRNTQWAIGCAVYTGKDTKFAQNTSHPPAKLSRVDTAVNNAIKVIFFVDLALVTASTLLLINFEERNFGGLYYLGYWDDDKSDPAVRAYVDERYPNMEWQDETSTFISGWLTFLVLFNNFIPLSMYVTLEIVTFIQLSFVNTDVEMYDETTDTPARARSNNVTDLGMIQYIFSDKTGTLTQNIMKFKCCSVAGQIYGSAMPSGYIMDPEKMPYSSMPIEHLKGNIFAEKSTEGKIFAEVLSLCHSVVVERENGGIVYQAESPDEGALVAAASDIGYTLVSRDTSGMTIDIGKAGGAESKGVLFEELAINEFDATRKRMSVMIRYPDGKGRLLVKGADSSMLRVAANAESDEVANMNDHLVFFAKQGLRTLVLGYRDFTAQELEAWLTEYQTASTSVENHDQKVMDCAISAEKNLTIIGATAIEDKLQDGVPDTIETVLQAGIKFWVLTGDKRETAIEIGKSCGLIQEGMTMVSLRGGSESFVHWQLCELYSAFVSPEDQDAAAMDSASLSLMSCINDKSTVSNAISNMMASTEAPADAASRGVLSGTDLAEAIAAGGKVAFVMEGTALEHVMPFEHMKAMLFGVAAKCHAVVACRATPSQKALLVETVQTYVKPKPVTLAIGDGANDVGMIQKAQVGVGIAGLEGQQAVNASDFAIAQFRFLKRLLLVHGRWNYRRMSVVILYSFYKNFVMVVTLFLFNFSCGFSGTPLYDQWLYSAYNFFTTLPVIAVGIFEKDVSADYAMKHPYLYIQGRNNLDMDAKAICSWVGTALVHGIIIYGIPFLQYPGMTDDGMGQGFLVWGTTVFISLVFSMNTKVLEETRTVTYCGGETLSLGTKKGRKAWCSNFAGWTVFLWMFSMFFLFFVLLVYSTYPFASLEILGDLTFLDMGTFVLGRASTWAYSMFTPLVSTLVGSLPWLLFWAFFPTPLILSIEDSRLNGNGRHQV